MKRTTLALAALLASTAITQAQSQNTILQSAGAWTASYYAKNNYGNPMCTVYTMSGNRSVYLKWETGDDKVFMHIFKGGWHVPSGVTMPLSITFDSNEPFTGNAHGLSGKLRHGVHVQLASRDSDAFAGFMAEFRDANMMTIRFPGGSEPPWSVDMKGSDVVGHTFMRCIDAVAGRATQPHNNSGGDAKSKTQPHSGKTQPATTTKPPGRDI